MTMPAEKLNTTTDEEPERKDPEVDITWVQYNKTLVKQAQHNK